MTDKKDDDLIKEVTADLDHLECGEPMIKLLKRLVPDKMKIQGAAKTMFKDYEIKKALAPDDFRKFETVVDKFSARFTKLSGSCLSKTAK